MAAATDQTYLLSQGKAYIATRVANGVQNSGFTWLGDIDTLTITSTQKFDDIEESYTGQRLIAAHAPIGTQLAAKMNCLQIDTGNLTRAYYGTYGGTVTGASVSSEPVILYNGAMTPLANPGVSAVAVTKTAGSLTLVAGTDYVVDAINGTLTVPSTSTNVPAGAGVACTVNYTFATYTGKVQAFTGVITEYAIRVQGFNTMNGNAPFLANLKRFSMNMAKTLSLIEAKHTVLELDGMLLPDTTAGVGLSQFFEIVKA